MSAAISLDRAGDGDVVIPGPLEGFRIGLLKVDYPLIATGISYAPKWTASVCPRIARQRVHGKPLSWLLPTAFRLNCRERTINDDMKRFAARVHELQNAGEPVKVYFGAGYVPIPGFLKVDIDFHPSDFAVHNPD